MTNTEKYVTVRCFEYYCMPQEFELLVKRIADETLVGDHGLAISSETERAYDRLLTIYHHTVDPVLKAMTSKDRYAAQYCIAFIEDCRRTILMMRALNRAILARRRGVHGDLHVVEAGMGSGLLLAASLALDPGVQCDGYDKVQGNQLVTSALLKKIRYETRVNLHHADLLQLGHRPKPHVLVAEHINQGLTGEHATKIPRGFEIDPQYVIPYAVIPGVYWNGINRIDKGEKIVLADTSATDQFVVKGELRLPPLAVQPVAVCCDVEWGASTLGSSSLLQSSQCRFMGADWYDHLLQAKWLPEESLTDENILAIKNTSFRAQTAQYQVQYPIGVFASKTAFRPKVRVSGNHCQSTVVFKGRALLTQSLSRTRSAWWRQFS